MPLKTNSNKTIKTLGGNRLGGYAIIWGDAQTADLDGEWFDPQTEELDRIYKAMGKLPFLYDHAMDNQVKTEVVGTVDVLADDDIGLWYEVQLDRANQYSEFVQQLANESKIGTSSGSLSGGVKVEKSGRISRWPIVEISGTTTPADPRQRTQHPVAELKSIYKSIGLDIETALDEDIKATEPKAEGNSAVHTIDDSSTAEALRIQIDILELET